MLISRRFSNCMPRNVTEIQWSHLVIPRMLPHFDSDMFVIRLTLNTTALQFLSIYFLHQCLKLHEHIFTLVGANDSNVKTKLQIENLDEVLPLTCI